MDLVDAGSKAAAHSLGRLIGRPVACGRREALTLQSLAGRHDDVTFVVGFNMQGAVRGTFALVMSEEVGNALAFHLSGRGAAAISGEGQTPERVRATLSELGNIGASAFANGVAEVARATCIPSVPALVVNKARAALAAVLGTPGQITVVRLDVATSAAPWSIDLAMSITA